MAAPVEYRSTDASAPSISGQAGSLITALSAILVDGYGSKPAAGWTKPYTSGSGFASFRQGSGNQHYFAVDDTGLRMARVKGFESMTDAVTGSGQFPSAAQITGGAFYIRKSVTEDSVARRWACYATGRSFYLFIFGNQAVSAEMTRPASTPGDCCHLAMGQTLQSYVDTGGYNTFIIGSVDASETDIAAGAARQVINEISASSNVFGHFVAREYDNSGGSVAMFKSSNRLYTPVRSGGANFTFPSSAGHLLLSRFYAYTSTSDLRRRGYLPGCWCIANGPANTSGLGQLQRVANDGSLNGRDFVLVYSGNGGVAMELADWGEP